MGPKTVTALTESHLLSGNSSKSDSLQIFLSSHGKGRATITVMCCSESRQFVILYGSQTGQSESIAEIICERASSLGLTGKIFSLNLHDKEIRLERENCVVIVCSSTGDGDPPENADKFYRRLMKKNLAKDLLCDVKFAMLGLGDSNYSTFGGCPTSIERRLRELGAVPFYPFALCDDAVGTEKVAEPWMEGLLPALCRTLSDNSGNSTKVSSEIVVPLDTRAGDVSQPSIIAKELTAYVRALDIGSSEDEWRDFSCTLATVPGSPCRCSFPEDSLRHAARLGIDSAQLKTTNASPSYLSLTFADDKMDCSSAVVQNGCNFPSCASAISNARLLSRRCLTQPGATKEKYEIRLDLQDARWSVEPGDALYFICPNSASEVDWLLRRLGLYEDGDKRCTISILQETEKRNPALPPHLNNPATLRHWLTTCLDIRKPVSKMLLRIMADCARNVAEKLHLLELCSTQGTESYIHYVVAAKTCVLDVLHAFPSVHVPMERLLEHLPRLQARSYSVANWSSVSHNRMRFSYTLVKFPCVNSRFFAREGLATGWLTSLPLHAEVPVFLKKHSHFRLPAHALDIPLIMVGPGTGVAPLLAFLEFLREETVKQSATATERAERWLFFGCRHEKLDYIYRDELQEFLAEGLLSHLVVCFSQDEQPTDAPRYVQHNLVRHGQTMWRLLQNARTHVFVCGDAHGMAVGVFDAFVRICAEHGGQSVDQAKAFMESLQAERRYLQDIWS